MFSIINWQLSNKLSFARLLHHKQLTVSFAFSIENIFNICLWKIQEYDPGTETQRFLNVLNFKRITRCWNVY